MSVVGDCVITFGVVLGGFGIGARCRVSAGTHHLDEIDSVLDQRSHRSAKVVSCVAFNGVPPKLTRCGGNDRPRAQHPRAWYLTAGYRISERQAQKITVSAVTNGCQATLEGKQGIFRALEGRLLVIHGPGLVAAGVPASG